MKFQGYPTDFDDRASLRWRLLPARADLVITHALEWPSLTVQWLPVRAELALG
jgi:Histone-binding protein RBBP4 or subunit C of CAF1 complex